MINIFGIVFSGLGTVIFLFKNVWDKKICKKIPYGTIGIILLFIGIFLSSLSSAINHKSDKITKSQIASIDTTVKITYNSFSKGFVELDEDRTVILEKLDYLYSTVIEQSDSSLKAELLLLNREYIKLKENLEEQKALTHRYYFSENWPESSKDFEISNILFWFFPENLYVLNGKDRYVVWKLIEHNGIISNHSIYSLHDEIWSYLKPMSLSMGTILGKLNLLGIIKPNYWKGNLEFTSEYMKRLNIYNKYYGTDKILFEKEMYKRIINYNNNNTTSIK